MDTYNRWPLSRQLQVTFTIATVILSLILVVITKFQLDWLYDAMQSKSKTMLEGNTIAQMEYLGKTDAAFIQQDFENYIGIVEFLVEINLRVLGFSGIPPLVQTTLLSADDILSDTLNYTQASYFTRNVLSDEGTALLEKTSAINPLYILMQHPSILSLYQGYFTDEIIYIYPGTSFSDTSYTPLVREWFYKADEAPGTVIITEPYIDAASGNWIITVSKAILDRSNAVYGVAAVDITLQTLTEKTSNIIILDNGFALLVTVEGLIIANPSFLEIETSTRIYNETATGITEDMWGTMVNASDGTRFDFLGFNSTNFIMVMYKISPFSDNNSTTHYLMILANKTDLDTQKNNLEHTFSLIGQIIFWVVLTIAIFVLVTTLILLYLESKSITRRLRNIEKAFLKIIRRGLFPRLTQSVKCKKMQENCAGIENLVAACQYYIEGLTVKEDNFRDFSWGVTRPSNTNLFSNWSEKTYPFNLHHDKSMAWKQAFPKIEKALERGL